MRDPKAFKALFCPTPCQTIWPVAEAWNWATTVSGVAAVVALARQLRAGAPTA